MDVLTREFSQYFPKFSEGDLLISLRNVHSIFVLDQKSLNIKWSGRDLFNFQHDPDWNYSGNITLFDNNRRTQESNIVEIDVSTGDHRRLIDKTEKFYVKFRGNHQIFSDGSILVSDSLTSFKVFDKSGQTIAAFENTGFEDKSFIVNSVFYVNPEKTANFEQGCIN